MPHHASALPTHIRQPFLPRLLRRFALVLATHRDRRALLRLEPHLLRDIGLTEDQARAEASRSVWDVPSHWRS